MNVNIEVLIDSMPYLGQPVALTDIMRVAGEEGTDPIAYKKALISYMKKKVKKFTVSQDTFTVHQYIKADLPDLFKYFNLYFKDEELKGENRRNMKFIKIETLYQAWRDHEKRTPEQFNRELTRYIANNVGRENTFIFDGELFIRPYKSVRSSIGVSL